MPNFVLQELRHIATARIRTNAGAPRGLDILHRMQRSWRCPCMWRVRDYDDIAEVDAKLLKLAQDMSGVVVTNDYILIMSQAYRMYLCLISTIWRTP